MKRVFPILEAVIILMGSTFLDNTFQRFGKFQFTKDPVIPFGAEIPVYIFLSVLLLGLAWYVLYVNPRNLLMAFAYIMVGALVLYSMSISGYFFWGSYLSESPAIYLWFSDSVASNFAFTRNSAAMILAIGLISLIPKRFLWRHET